MAPSLVPPTNSSSHRSLFSFWAYKLEKDCWNFRIPFQSFPRDQSKNSSSIIMIKLFQRQHSCDSVSDLDIFHVFWWRTLMNLELHNSGGTLILLLMCSDVVLYCRLIIEVYIYSVNNWMDGWMDDLGWEYLLVTYCKETKQSL